MIAAVTAAKGPARTALSTAQKAMEAAQSMGTNNL
jgi:hypothetical protein